MAEPAEARGSVPRGRPRYWPLLLAWNLAYFAAWVAGPFLAAGTVRWPACWAYFGVIVLCGSAHGTYYRRRNPELAKRRRRLGAGTQRWDLLWNLLFWPLMAAIPIVAGSGVRAAAAPLPFSFWFLGLALLGGGFVLSAWAMGVNPHFEGTVRLQTDVGHRVIDLGPYRRIRHPGYVGLALWALGTPLLLLSARALWPAALVIAWLVLRTALEDGFLRRELPGYKEFAERTRFRWIPGVW